MYFHPSPLPLQHVRELPEFAYLMSLDRSKWPRCLLWHGWLSGLSGSSDRDPWATSFGDLAFVELERYLGTYPVDFSGPGMLMIFPWKSLSTLMFGLMLAGRISPL